MQVVLVPDSDAIGVSIFADESAIITESACRKRPCFERIFCWAIVLLVDFGVDSIGIEWDGPKLPAKIYYNKIFHTTFIRVGKGNTCPLYIRHIVDSPLLRWLCWRFRRICDGHVRIAICKQKSSKYKNQFIYYLHRYLKDRWHLYPICELYPVLFLTPF